MTVAAVFSAIVAALNALPIIKGWVEQFIAYFVQTQLASMKAENAAAIRKAINEHDQRDLERTMGSPRAGEPSGIPGTDFVTSLPGVPDAAGSHGNNVVK